MAHDRLGPESAHAIVVFTNRWQTLILPKDQDQD